MSADDCYECGASPADCTCEDGPYICECVRVDVDLDDARGCRIHGPHGTEARRSLEREAAAEAAYWSDPGWKEVFK